MQLSMAIRAIEMQMKHVMVVQGITLCSSNSEHQPFFQELVLL